MFAIAIISADYILIGAEDNPFHQTDQNSLTYELFAEIAAVIQSL
jgi:hypothetical protein